MSLRALQTAAVAAVKELIPSEQAGRVVVYSPQDRRLLDVVVPLVLSGETDESQAPGWSDRDGRVYFDGRLVPITGRKLKVLRLLIEREVASVDDLRAAWDGAVVEDATVRWQIGELRKALSDVFGHPDPISNAKGGGYSLQIR